MRFAKIEKLLTFCSTLYLRYLTQLWIYLWGTPFPRVKYFMLEIFHRTFHWVANEPFLSDSRVTFWSSLTGEPLLLTFHVSKRTVIYFKYFCCSFSNVSIAAFCFHIEWSDIFFSILQKVLWILSANVMQDYQFKYISHCLCISYPEPFLFSRSALHILECKGSCQELLFCSTFSFFYKSDNTSSATFRGGA